MSRRAKLKRLVGDLKRYVRRQRRDGAAGSVPASAEAREAFEARARARRKERIAALKGTPPEERPSTPTDSPDVGAPGGPTSPDKSPPEPEQTGNVRPPGGPTSPTMPSSKSEAPPSAPAVSDGESALWKTMGSRPKKKFGGNDSEQQPAPPTQEANDTGQNPSSPQSDTPPSTKGSDVKDPSEMTRADKLDFLREYLGDCRRCGLCEGRTNIVFGDGDPEARLVFVGEAPGYHEDQQGIPFVGRAGKLLDKMIEGMGLRREETYICNIIKCRPPDNRDPQSDEIRECSPFVEKQLEAIDPEVIVALGRFAAQHLTGAEDALGRMQGRWHSYKETPVMPLYHPAYLLRNPEAKRGTWNALKMVMAKLGLEESS